MSSPTAVVQASLWSAVWKLLRLRALITFNNIRRAKTRSKIGYAILGLLILAALAGIFIVSWLLLGLLRSPEVARYINPSELIANVPVWVLTAAFFGLLLTSFGVLLQSLYLAADMDFLLSAPVSMRAVFLSKLIQAILPDLGLVSLFGLPVLFGLGAAMKFSLLYYPLVLAVFLGVAIIASSIASLVVMAVVRLFPARRVAEVLGFFGALLSLVCSQSGQLINTVRVNQGQVSGALGSLSQVNSPWSPLAWAGQGLLNVANGDWLAGLGSIFLFLGISGGIFFAALVTAERLYYIGWARVQVGGRKKRIVHQIQPRLNTKQTPLMAAANLIPSVVRSVTAKDFRTIRRDLRNMSQIIAPLIFGLIYAFSFARGGGYFGRGEAPQAFNRVLQIVIVDANTGFAIFFSWAVLSRLALMSFSQEGKQYWLLKSSPATPVQLVAAKYWVAYIPGVLLGSLFLLMVSLVQRSTPISIAFGLVVIVFGLAGAAGVSLAFGIANVNLKWEDPRRMVRGTGGCLAMIVSMAYIAGILALFFGPPIIFSLVGWDENLGRLVGLALGIPASLLCAVLPPRLLMNKVALIGEE